MKQMYVFDKINNDIKEVAVINYVEEAVLLWTNSKGARATTPRKFSDIEMIDNNLERGERDV